MRNALIPDGQVDTRDLPPNVASRASVKFVEGFLDELGCACPSPTSHFHRTAPPLPPTSTAPPPSPTSHLHRTEPSFLVYSCPTEPFRKNPAHLLVPKPQPHSVVPCTFPPPHTSLLEPIDDATPEMILAAHGDVLRPWGVSVVSVGDRAPLRAVPPSPGLVRSLQSVTCRSRSWETPPRRIPTNDGMDHGFVRVGLQAVGFASQSSSDEHSRYADSLS